MITDWRGRPLEVGDHVLYVRHKESLTVGRILEFHEEYGQSTYGAHEPGLTIQVVEQTNRFGNDSKPSRVKLKYCTKVEP